MLLGLVLSLAGIAFFAWAMLRLAVYALPGGLGFMAFLWAVEGAAGLAVGILLGLGVGVAAFLAGRALIASRLPGPVGVGVAVLCALPAGIAGPTPATIAAVIGGIVIAFAALASLVPSVVADPRAGHGRPIAR